MKYLFIFFFLGTINLMACNSKIHHSVMSHYNHAQVVVIAKVVKIGNGKSNFSFKVEDSRRKSYFMKLKIIKTYKNKTIHTKEIIVGKSPNDYANYEKGKTYLIHAYPHVAYDFLLVNQGVDIEDEEGMKRYDFMDQVPRYHTGEVKEFSTYGRLRAKGKLVNGIPEGEWLYYGYSGELQIKGTYQNGEETGLWKYYYHTEDRAYELLHKIYSGAYYEWSQDYKPIQLDTNLTGQYQKRIIYMVDSQKVTELFYYNQRIPQKIVCFKGGKLHGIEKTMTLNGAIHTQYSFKEGILDGAYFTVQPLPSQEGVTLRVEGEYRANQKYMETHLYYEKEHLFQTKIILDQGKLVE